MSIFSSLGKLLDNPVTRAISPVVSRFAPLLSPVVNFANQAVVAANRANAPTGPLVAGSTAGGAAVTGAAQLTYAQLPKGLRHLARSKVGSAAFQSIKNLPVGSAAALAAGLPALGRSLEISQKVSTLPSAPSLSTQIVGRPQTVPQLIQSPGTVGGGGLIQFGTTGLLQNLFPIPSQTQVAQAVGGAMGFTVTRKRRRMNVGNMRAARRAARRLRGAHKLLKRIERLMPTRTVHTRSRSPIGRRK